MNSSGKYFFLFLLCCSTWTKTSKRVALLVPLQSSQVFHLQQLQMLQNPQKTWLLPTHTWYTQSTCIYHILQRYKQEHMLISNEHRMQLILKDSVDSSATKNIYVFDITPKTVISPLSVTILVNILELIKLQYIQYAKNINPAINLIQIPPEKDLKRSSPILLVWLRCPLLTRKDTVLLVEVRLFYSRCLLFLSLGISCGVNVSAFVVELDASKPRSTSFIVCKMTTRCHCKRPTDLLRGQNKDFLFTRLSIWWLACGGYIQYSIRSVSSADGASYCARFGLVD